MYRLYLDRIVNQSDLWSPSVYLTSWHHGISSRFIFKELEWAIQDVKLKDFFWEKKPLNFEKVVGYIWKLKKCFYSMKKINWHVWHEQGEGGRPQATTFFPSMSRIFFFVFQQPWTTTARSSMPHCLSHLTVITFSSDNLGHWNCNFLRSWCSSRKIIPLRNFRSLLRLMNFTSFSMHYLHT